MSKLDKNVRDIIAVNGWLFLIAGGLSLAFGGAGLGAMAVVFGLVNLFAALVNGLGGKWSICRTYLIAGGVSLLTGSTICSSYSFM